MSKFYIVYLGIGCMKIGCWVFVFVLFVGFASAAFGDCLESELYKPHTGKCVPKCTAAQDYVDGECLLKCRDLENNMWSVEENKCVHICSVNPDFGYICDDYNEGEVEVCSGDMCRGAFTFVSGRVLVERGMDIFSAKVGDELLPGDTVVVDDDARVVLNLINSGEVVIDEKAKFEIPVAEKLVKERSNVVVNFFTGIYKKFKGWLDEEKFEGQRSTDSARRA